MYCLGCNYNLTGLGAVRGDGTCPECGRGFDPDDNATFDSHPHRVRDARRLEIAIIVLATNPLITNILAHVTLVGARLSLGRWPHRWGRDDPSDIPGIGWLYYLTGLTLLIIPASLFLTLLFLCLLARRNAWSRVARAWLIGSALWAAGLWTILADPAETWVWYMD